MHSIKSGWFWSLLTVMLALVMPIAVASGSVDADLGENEVKMGKESAAEVAKEYKFSDNAADLKRVREIGAKLAAIANKKQIKALYGSPKVTPFDYKFEIIEDKDVNAFSVPGGHIYIYRGLLDFVQSDHELAGVIAHEVIHDAHHHMVFLLRKQASLNNQLAIALLATMISGANSTDVGNVLTGLQLYQIAKLNGYGQQAERDADYGAINLMLDSGYNPVGLLTFMERLAKRSVLVDYGIYQSHPLDADRVKAAKAAIEELNLPINRRETTNAVYAQVTTEITDGKETPEVAINGKVIYRPAHTIDKTSLQRAQEAADRINRALDSQLQIHELTVDPLVGGVIARGEALFVVSEADAKLMNKTPAQASKDGADAIRNILWRQLVDTIH